MPILLENLIATVIWLIIIGLVLTGGFIMVTVQRRITRRRYFQRLDRARHRAQELADPFYEGTASIETTLEGFRNFRSEVERRALEETLLWHTKVPAHVAPTREIVERLGWIDEWTSYVRSRVKKPKGAVATVIGELGDKFQPNGGLQLRLKANFVARALAADKLARVPTPEGLMALLVGTQDPHLDVREVCMRMLGRLADPVTIPVLLENLVDVLEGRNKMSVRNVKTALVQFHLEEIDAMRPGLEHANRRVRFFCTDVIREIADKHAQSELLSKNDFTPEMYRLFTEKLSTDPWGDVRARAAVVVAHFHDNASNDILQSLLNDKEWFVRLHACRAAAGKFFMPIAPAVAQKLTDQQWLVREASVRSLRDMGDFGIEQIYRTFLSTEDRYAAEQIGEEVQRSGMLAELFANIETEEQRRQAMMVARRMVSLGKITMLLNYLMSPVQADLKMMLVRELSVCPLPECLETLRRCAEQDPDPRVRNVAGGAFQTAITSARTAAVSGRAQ